MSKELGWCSESSSVGKILSECKPHSTSPRLLALDLSYSCSPLAAASQGHKSRTLSSELYCLASLSNWANGVSRQHFLTDLEVLTIVGSLFDRPTVEHFPLIPSFRS